MGEWAGRLCFRRRRFLWWFYHFLDLQSSNPATDQTESIRCRYSEYRCFCARLPFLHCGRVRSWQGIDGKHQSVECSTWNIKGRKYPLSAGVLNPFGTTRTPVAFHVEHGPKRRRNEPFPGLGDSQSKANLGIQTRMFHVEQLEIAATISRGTSLQMLFCAQSGPFLGTPLHPNHHQTDIGR